MNRTILVIDDDTDIRESVRDLLEQEGYAVALAGDGREGLDALERTRPFLVLLDLMMPVMNGFAFLQAIRQRPFNPPVVALTAASEKLIPTDFVAGAIRKPIDVGQLLAMLEQHHPH